MTHPSSSIHQHGFTLIELMVVIVIVGVMTSLVVMNLSGIDQRKAMQAREMLILDLRKINREANDQARIYALVTDFSQADGVFSYQVNEYTPISADQPAKIASASQNRWNALTEFKPRVLPAKVSFSIESQQHDFDNANNSDLLGANAPQLIWLGNGETKPVNIQMYYDQKPVGEQIQVDYLGKVIDEK